MVEVVNHLPALYTLMATGYLFLAIFIVGLKDGLGQSTTCEAIRQFTQDSLICTTPANCCTRILCNILAGSIYASDFQVNPCSSPPSLSGLIEAGGSVLFNESGISTSQEVPISYAGGLSTDLNIFVNSTEDALTFAISIGDTKVIPKTTIPIDTSQCPSNSMEQPDICFPMTATATATPGPVTPPPSSIPTCLALQQVANPNRLDPAACAVTNRCTTLSCTYLNFFPFSIMILPCSTPPAIGFIIFDRTDGSVLINETLSRSRAIPLEELASDTTAVYINVEHPCGRSAIILQVDLYTSLANLTVIPQTEIPIDQSNCSSVGPSSYPCTTSPPLPNTTCGALQTASRSSGDVCSATPKCSSVVCDLNTFSLPILFNMTVLPCMEIPGVNIFVTNNGVVLLDETLTRSRVETVRVGPANVTLNITVLQSSDMSSIEVGVELVVSQSPVSFPVFPLTVIPLDRCSCPQITCLSTTAGPIATPSSQSSTSSGSPVQSTGSEVASTTLQPGTDSFTNANVATQSLSSSNSKVVAPAVIAAVLFVVLVVTIATAAVILIVMKRRHEAYRKSFDNMTYGYVKVKDNNVE